MQRGELPALQAHEAIMTGEHLSAMPELLGPPGGSSDLSELRAAWTQLAEAQMLRSSVCRVGSGVELAAISSRQPAAAPVWGQTWAWPALLARERGWPPAAGTKRSAHTSVNDNSVEETL